MKNSPTKKLTIHDIVRSKTRFQICNFLIIYRELSILELSRRIGKTKSTIYEHLKKMIEAGYVKESREEKARSNIPTKYYSWVEKDTEEKKKKPNYSEENCRLRIDTLKSFAVLNQSILKNWINFLDLLEKKIDNGNLEETITILKKLYEHPAKPYHSVAFYTPKNAALFYEKIRELYHEIPDEVETKSDENPYYGGLILLPIRDILDYVYPKGKERWRK